MLPLRTNKKLHGETGETGLVVLADMNDISYSYCYVQGHLCPGLICQTSDLFTLVHSVGRVHNSMCKKGKSFKKEVITGIQEA